MRKRVVLLLAVAFFFSTLVAVGHFHDDGCDHDDCPKCIVLHHSKSPDIVYGNIDLAPDVAAIEYNIVEPSFNLPVRVISSQTIRPPPA